MHWHPSGLLTINFKHVCGLWAGKVSAVVRVTVPKNHDRALLLFVKNVWFIVVRGELRTCDSSEIDLSAKTIYSLKLLTI